MSDFPLYWKLFFVACPINCATAGCDMNNGSCECAARYFTQYCNESKLINTYYRFSVAYII